MKNTEKIGIRAIFSFLILSSFISGCAIFRDASTEKTPQAPVYLGRKIKLHYDNQEVIVFEKDTTPYQKRSAQLSRRWRTPHGELFLINFPRNSFHGFYSVLFEKPKLPSLDTSELDIYEIKNPLNDPYSWFYPNDKIGFSSDSNRLYLMMRNEKSGLHVKFYWDFIVKKWVNC
ncbi:MAG: hypothetical protein RL687_131 [Candidatus Parcubacteria bacterium]|jgi:hypothetical protein